MDFVQWCGVFLSTILNLQESSPNGSEFGIRFPEIESALVGDGPSRLRSEAVLGAYREFNRLGVIENKHNYLKIPRSQKQFARDQREEWLEISRLDLDPEEAQLLRALNRLSEHRHLDFAYIGMVPYEELYAALDLEPGYESERRVDQLLRNLKAFGCATLNPFMGRSNLAAQSTYVGLVWEHRSAMTVSSSEIDLLVQEGETLTVELKRQLELRTASQKAEFIKDVIALANTKAVGPRYLLVGFRNDGQYYDPEAPDERAIRDRLLAALSAERLQAFVSGHIIPVIQVRYDQVDHYEGPIGKLEIVRDVTELPVPGQQDDRE